jgi:hypothetical protein
MRKTSLLATSAVLILSSALLGGSFSDAIGKPPKIAKILEFDTMVGLPQAFTGTQNPIRGINGGGLPWMIGGASGELKVDGHLEIAVSGLAFAAGPNAGSNTIASFRAIVSCLGSDGSVVNVITDPFPATTGPASTGGGNAEIETDLLLPQPCIAPIIFVTSPGGAWFATTGH